MGAIKDMAVEGALCLSMSVVKMRVSIYTTRDNAREITTRSVASEISLLPIVNAAIINIIVSLWQPKQYVSWLRFAVLGVWYLSRWERQRIPWAQEEGEVYCCLSLDLLTIDKSTAKSSVLELGSRDSAGKPGWVKDWEENWWIQNGRVIISYGQGPWVLTSWMHIFSAERCLGGLGTVILQVW